MLLLNHWADMTLHLKDVIYIVGAMVTLIVTLSGAWFVQKNNTKRIEKLEEDTDVKDRLDKLEKKNDDFTEIITNFKVELAKMKYEIIEAVTKIFNGKK